MRPHKVLGVAADATADEVGSAGQYPLPQILEAM